MELTHSRADQVLRILTASRWALLLGFTSSAAGVLWWRSVFRASAKRLEAATASDPSLLRKHTTYQSYTTQSGITYPRIRTFYKDHQQASQLPADLPLLVFMHGLGGSMAQFEPLLTNLINLAPCLAIDLPGCGLSAFEPGNRDAYSTKALAELLATAISKHLDIEQEQKVVLVGHSMGCSINVLLASSTSHLASLLDDCIAGVVAICPSASPPGENELHNIRKLGRIPVPLFDIFRWYDRRGGLHSRSVERMVGSDADMKTRKLQMRYNEQSQTAVFQRMIAEGIGKAGFPGHDVWAGVKVPLFLVGGEADTVTPVAEVERITEWLTGGTEHNDSHHNDDGKTKTPPVPATAGDAVTAQTHLPSINDVPKTPRTESGSIIKDDHTATKHEFALKTTVFPTPSGHGLMYTTAIVRILSGMIENFFARHVDERLGPSWQLRHLTTAGKWDVKNIKKWQAVEACSVPIGGLFRAMKTMREVDDEHCPKEFVKKYSFDVVEDGVAAVVDISHESPVYHPKGLEDAGVEYHKFPTVSKETPKAEEVERFIELIDKIRKSSDKVPPATIGVHCHYGFNRTGFLIICYLVERKNYKLQDALEEFAQKRTPGIKHPHFENELFVRYGMKMDRRGTIVGK